MLHHRLHADRRTGHPRVPAPARRTSRHDHRGARLPRQRSAYGPVQIRARRSGRERALRLIVVFDEKGPTGHATGRTFSYYAPPSDFRLPSAQSKLPRKHLASTSSKTVFRDFNHRESHTSLSTRPGSHNAAGLPFEAAQPRCPERSPPFRRKRIRSRGRSGRSW